MRTGLTVFAGSLFNLSLFFLFVKIYLVKHLLQMAQEEAGWTDERSL